MYMLLAGLLASCANSVSDDMISAAARFPVCSEATGLAAPLPACTPETPCNRTASEVAGSTIRKPTVVPECADPWDEMHTQEVLGFTRHACIYRPPGASANSKRPLVLWFHPGGNGTAQMAGTEASLLFKAPDYDLTGDPKRPGFVLAAVQGRNLRFPTAAPRDGHHHDFYFRDLQSPSTNPDIANVDALIDALVAEGNIDTSRIYLMGWSNGAFFSQLYTIARDTTATPAGNRVAAAAVFSAGSPFAGISWDPFNLRNVLDEDDCQPTEYPESENPILIVYRTTDSAVPCDSVQADCFGTEPGYTTLDWINDAIAAGLKVQGLIIGGLEAGKNFDETMPACLDFSGGCPEGNCRTSYLGVACLSLLNHLRWPDGDYHNHPTGTADREIDMLEFLKANPRQEDQD